MSPEVKRCVGALADAVIGDRADRRVVRPVLLAMLLTSVRDFERYWDARYAEARLRDFDILVERNKAAKGVCDDG